MRSFILCGGSGTRLWPLSRSDRPKQFIALNNQHSLLQNTYLRTRELASAEPLVICNEAHYFAAREQLKEVGGSGVQLMMEPVARNTAPAIVCAALAVMQTEGDQVLLVMPSDHIIADEQAFALAVQEGRFLAEQGYLVTFGVHPETAETGYGYIQCGQGIPNQQGDSGTTSFKVAAFHEKPDRLTAERYLADGRYYWNSGIFMFRASVLLDELKAYHPEIFAVCEKTIQQAKLDEQVIRLDKASFKACPSDSIDYAVMEKTKKAAMVRLDSGWSDVGTWDAVWQSNQKTPEGNVIQGDVVQHGTHNSLLKSTHRLLVVNGVEDMIIVETPDVVLVTHKSKAQNIKEIVSELSSEQRSEATTHRKVYRPWGAYDSIDKDLRHQVKRITVKPKQRLSTQLHYHRAEHWIVVSGTAHVTIGEEKKILTENQSIYIPSGMAHCLENPGIIDLELIEVQTGSYLGEDDIVRFDDIYGRHCE